MDLKKLFKNHFDTDKISDDNLRKFAEIHLERLSANNGTAQFTTMITATTTAYTNYFGAMTNEDTKFAIQQGLTVTMTNIVENFKNFASKKEGLVFGNYGKESPEYQEFYPNGVSEYRQANLANIETLMSRFFAAAERHQAELGASLQSDAENFLTDFKNARTAQLTKIGEVQAQKSTTSTTRDGIENELMRNVHLIASMFIGEVDRCMDFFDQSFIRGSETADEEEEPPVPPVV